MKNKRVSKPPMPAVEKALREFIKTMDFEGEKIDLEHGFTTLQEIVNYAFRMGYYDGRLHQPQEVQAY